MPIDFCNIFTYPLSGDSEDFNAHSHIVDLSIIDCTPTCTQTVLSNCDSVHNCQFPQSTKNHYFNPLLVGDSFVFQTKFVDFFNPDPEVPVTGWTAAGLGLVTAELLNPDGTLLSDDHTLFATKYLVGWTGEESYQLIEIDYDLLKTNFPAIECFSFKFVAYNDLNVEVDSICSEHFQLHESCKDTIIIASESTTDCCGNYYGSPEAFVGNTNFQYNNAWRYHASIRRVNTEFEKTTFGTKRTKVEVNRLFLLQLKRLIPAYLFNYLTEIHLAGEKVYIDGEEYFIDTFSFDNESERKMFIGRIEVFQTCDSSFNC